MMATAFRVIGSIVAGLAIAFALVIAVEFASSVLHPLPPDFSGAMDEMCKHVERYPAWVLALVVPAWAGTTFIATWVARRIGNRGSGAFVGVFLLASVVFNIAMLPYPIWFKVANLIAIPAAVYFGLKPPRRTDAIPAGVS